MEDVVESLMFGVFWVIWHLYGKYPSVELIMLGLLAGTAVGLLSNRLRSRSP